MFQAWTAKRDDSWIGALRGCCIGSEVRNSELGQEMPRYKRNKKEGVKGLRFWPGTLKTDGIADKGDSWEEDLVWVERLTR